METRDNANMLDLGRTFLQSAERSPDALALVDGARRLDYAQWYGWIAHVAQGLRALGVERGARVLAVLQNRAEMATVHWACQFLGAVMTPLNWRAKPQDVGYVLRDAQPSVVLFEAVSANAVRQAPGIASARRIAVDCAAQPDELSFASLGAHGDAPTLHPEASAEDYSLLLYTSGTTGNPKGVPRRHRHERASALGHVAQNLYRRGERTLGVMPLYHTMGVRSLLSMAIVDGRFVCMPRFDAREALQVIAAESISCLYLVPTLYHDMLTAHAQATATDLTSVRKLGFAGAPMPQALLQRLQQAFSPELFVNHYGSSEVYTMSIEQDAAARPGSAGRAGVNTRLRVIKLDGGIQDETVPGEEGQIIADLSGDEAFEGYWQRPDANAKSLRDGWYLTGDTGYRDARGDLYVTGRVDDMIVSGGENISPVEIESVLSLHAAVDEVAVVGLPDARWGQQVTAFVTCRAPVTPQALDAHCCASELLNFKRPRQYIFVRAIPKSPVGKILRRKLLAGEYELAGNATDAPPSS